jgi:hypothetical protein
MNAIRFTPLTIVTALVFALLLAACGPSGPPPVKPGSPEFNWQAAKEAYKKGDYAKAQDLLVDLAKKDTPLAAQARPWAMVMSLAMANGYWELSEKYTEGSKKPRVNAVPLRRLVGEYRAKTTAAGMQYTEITRAFLTANKDQDVTLAFDLSQASTNEPQQYSKITAGTMLPEAELAGVERNVIQRQLLLVVATAMNLKKDPNKVKDAYQNGELKVPGQGFLFAVAQGCSDIADLFGPKKLFQPARIITVLYDEAKDALGMIKDNKEAKDLLQKVTAAQKKLKD